MYKKLMVGAVLASAVAAGCNAGPNFDGGKYSIIIDGKSAVYSQKYCNKFGECNSCNLKLDPLSIYDRHCNNTVESVWLNDREYERSDLEEHNLSVEKFDNLLKKGRNLARAEWAYNKVQAEKNKKMDLNDISRILKKK